jgi:hypothetical protein
VSSLPTPPREWIVRSRYFRRGPCHPGTPLEREAAVAYAYEQELGRPPPDDFAPGTRAWQQFVYRGQGDPKEVAT